MYVCMYVSLFSAIVWYINLLQGPCKCLAPLILETWYGPVTVDYHVFDQVQFVIATQKSPFNLVRRLFTYF